MGDNHGEECLERFIAEQTLGNALLLLFPSCINAQEDKQQDGESPKRRTAITEERQGDTDDGSETNNHPYVDKDMEEQYAQHTITIDTSIGVSLAFGKIEQSQNEC